MDRSAMPQVSQVRNVMGNVPEGRFERSAAVVRVASESPQPFDLQRKIQLPFVFQPRPLAFRKDAKNHVSAGIQSQGRFVQRREVSVEAGQRRRLRRQVQVRCPKVDNGCQQLNKINLRHRGLSPCGLRGGTDTAQGPLEFLRIIR